MVIIMNINISKVKIVVMVPPDLASGTAITFDAVVLDDPLGTGGSARVTLRLTR